ncbi:MAG TPA: hypothetical protein VH678_32485 [Xanthobacteraceae bacterium]
MISCAFCHGQVSKQSQRMKFRQWSDKGYVQCEVMIAVHVCSGCGMQMLDDTADRVMDEAFRREYRKLP